MTPERAVAELDALARELPDAPGSIERTSGSDPLVETWVVRNPSARGALTAGMMASLARGVLELDRPGPPVLVIRGEDGSFCSGGHLGQVRAGLGEPARGHRMAVAMAAVLDALAGGPRLVVGLVDGPALGGGAELLTACDHVLCGPRARIGFVQAALGVAPGWGGAARLVRRVGTARALRLLTAAPVLGPEEAVAAGLADAAGADAEAALAGFLAPLRAVSADALRAVKRQIAAASPVARTPDEARAFAEVWGSAEHLRRLGPGRG